jgi:uncharacterized protein (DUF305 family)
MKHLPALLFLIATFAPLPALADGTGHAAMSAKSNDPYAESRDRMHKDMMVAPTGDADADFVRNMLPHHQGAVDMAKVELEHGRDPELRRLAQAIVDAQEKEIRFMRDWLSKHEKKATR